MLDDPETTHANDTNRHAAELVRPISPTSDRIVIDQAQADKIRRMLARNDAIKTQAWRRSPQSYAELMTATNAQGYQ